MSAAVSARSELIAAIADGIAAHYRRTLKVQDRLDSLDGRTGPLASEELRDADGVAREIARELVAEVLRIAGEPRLEPVLVALADAPGTAPALARRIGSSRLALVRRVGELTSAGLAERDPDTDLVRATQLGASVAALLAELTGGVADVLAESAR